MNPCVCGRLGQTDWPCACTPATVANYRARVSGPLIDRFEMQVEVPPVPIGDLAATKAVEPSRIVAKRVAEARLRRGEALGPTLVAPAERILHQAIHRLGLSARAHDAILRVARTIAHLDHAHTIEPAHVAEAVQYRALDRGSTLTRGEMAVK